jgi:tetratricopeptide (TPR) repeat protein
LPLSARTALAVAALTALAALAGGCASNRLPFFNHDKPARTAATPGAAAPSAIDRERAESRFAAGVAMDLEAQELDELFSYQRLSRGNRQPSLLRDAKSFRQRSLEAFDEALKADPASAIILRRKGDVLLELGQTDDALKLYKAADALAPAETRWYFRVAGQMEIMGRADDAAQFLERAAATDESSDMREIALLELGDIYTKGERLDQAARVYREAVAAGRAARGRATSSIGQALASRLKEDPTGVRRMLVNVLVKAGSLDQALAEAQSSCQSAPADARPLSALVSVRLARKEYKEAVDEAEAFVSSKPADEVAVLSLIGALAAAGRVDDAVAHAKAYTAVERDDTRVRQEVIKILKTAGRPGDAEKYAFEDAPGGFPAYPVAMSLLDVYLSSRDAAKAFDLAQKILENNPVDVNAALQLVGQLWLALPAEGCEQFFNDYARTHRDDIRVTYGYAEVLKSKGRGADAGPLFVEVVEKGGRFSDAYEAAAGYLSSKGEYYRAATLFLKGVEDGLIPRPEANVQSIVAGAADPAGLAAKLAAREGDYVSAKPTLYEMVAALYLDAHADAKAETYYRKALEAPAPILVDYAGLAISLYRQDKTREAIALIEDLSKKGQGAPPLVRMLAAMLSHDGNYSNAERIATKLISEQPTDIENHLALVDVYVDQGNYLAAEKELELARGLAEGDDPELVKVRYMLGVVYDEEGKDDKAVAAWRENLAAAPDDADTNNALGYHFADRGVSLGEARTLVEKALKSEPDNSAYLDSMGWVYYKMNEFPAAVAALKKAAAREKDPVILDHLGDALAKSGDSAGAADAWKRSLAAKPKEKDRVKTEAKLKGN